MKKIFVFLPAILVLGLGGCDIEKSIGSTSLPYYASYGYFVWKNQSDHAISISVHEFRQLTNETMLQGEEISKKDGRGSSSLWSFTSDGISVAFDDGTYGVVFDFHGYGKISNEMNYPVLSFDYTNELGASEFNLQNERLYEHEYVENPEGCEVCVGHRWTYTFTNADYEAAKALSQN